MGLNNSSFKTYIWTLFRKKCFLKLKRIEYLFLSENLILIELELIKSGFITLFSTTFQNNYRKTLIRRLHKFVIILQEVKNVDIYRDFKFELDFYFSWYQKHILIILLVYIIWIINGNYNMKSNNSYLRHLKYCNVY